MQLNNRKQCDKVVNFRGGGIKSLCHIDVGDDYFVLADDYFSRDHLSCSFADWRTWKIKTSTNKKINNIPNGLKKRNTMLYAPTPFSKW